MTLSAILIITLATNVSGQAFPVTRIPTDGGEIVFANPGEREEMYDQLNYAAARRAGDYVYLSGVEVGPAPGEGKDAAALEKQLTRGFQAIQNSLAATGATMNQIIQLQSFHNCKASHFTGSFDDQLGAMINVKKTFMPPPYSTWTAVCVDRHYSANTVVEIQVTAYAPKK